MKYKKSAVSSAHIVAAATRVLARQGYAHTSLMDIANEADMSKGAVHYHFPTKESLMTVVLREACDAVARGTLAAWTEGDNPLQSLRSSLQELWRVRAQRTDEAVVVADLLAQSLHDSKLRSPLSQYYRFAVEQVEAHLHEQLGKIGLKPKVPPQLLARLLHALLDGLLMQALVDPDAFGPDEVVDALESVSLAMLDFGGQATPARDLQPSQTPTEDE